MTRAGGVVTILAGLPFDWFDQVLVEHEEADADAVLAGVARDASRAIPSSSACEKASTIDSSRRCSRQGWDREGVASMPGMVAFPIDGDAIGRHAVPGALDIRRVTDATGIEAHRGS